VEVVYAVVGAESGEKKIAVQHSGPGTSAVVRSDAIRTVVALDDLLKTSAPDLIKIDTDGYEINVVEGGRRCLKNIKPHLFIEYSPYHIRKHGLDEPTRLFALLKEAGYGAMIIYEHMGYPMCLIDFTSTSSRTSMLTF
jgi:hypothetical protein